MRTTWDGWDRLLSNIPHHWSRNHLIFKNTFHYGLASYPCAWICTKSESEWLESFLRSDLGFLGYMRKSLKSCLQDPAMLSRENLTSFVKYIFSFKFSQHLLWLVFWLISLSISLLRFVWFTLIRRRHIHHGIRRIKEIIHISMLISCCRLITGIAPIIIHNKFVLIDSSW